MVGKIIKEKCSSCGGKGYKRVNKTINLKIPAGIDDGQTLRLRGEGNSPTREGVSGDLNVRIKVAKDKILTRKEYDIYLDLYVPFTMAILGGKVEIPTVNGPYTLTIPELTMSGTVMRLKNKGVKYLNRDYYGDMLVTIKAEPPKSLDKKTKDALHDLQKSIGDKSYTRYSNFIKNSK